MHIVKAREIQKHWSYASSETVCSLRNVSAFVQCDCWLWRVIEDNKTNDHCDTTAKVFSPVRFGGNNYLKKRHFDKVRENSQNMLTYSGRAAVVVGKLTPLMFEYNIKQEKLTLHSMFNSTTRIISVST